VSPARTATRSPLLPLALISAAAVGYETALTRYFAVAKWSEYGYWVISIVMAGFALSGVAMALGRAPAERHAARLQASLPVLLILAAAVGFRLTVANPFNPLQLQNPATYLPQLGNIALYYAALLPFFFLAGLYVSLSFVLNTGRIGRTYAFDLTGAGLGAALVVGLMFLLHPFRLVPALLPLLAIAAPLAVTGRRARVATGVAALLALAGAEALLLAGPGGGFNEYKAIYAPLHVQGSRVLAQRLAPRGLYTLLDDFTERVDTDISNDAAMLNLPGPPRAYGLYRDGNRIAALPRAAGIRAPYAGAALEALPYRLVRGPDVLLEGASGGFRIAEALALGARGVTAIEPDPVLRGALRHGLGPSPPMAADARVRLLATSPLAMARRARDRGRYDLIDISADFLDEAEANRTAFSVEAIAADLRALTPDGMVSIPVSIREFPSYAIRLLATVRAALLATGRDDPARYVIVYRSAWNLRILVASRPWDAGRIEAARKFCDDRSFDVSFYPGIDVAAARAGIYNDLPAVSFDTGAVTSAGGEAHDAVADEAGAALAGASSVSQRSFDLAPITLDRPSFYNVLRLDRLPVILRRLEILPQPEIGQLINLAVLAQAAVIALLVLAVPLVAPRVAGARREGTNRVPLLRTTVYFAALGLGFLFIEIYLIDQASLALDDRTSAFALVLSAMLVFSGIGSWLAERVGGPLLPVAVILLWCAAAAAGLTPLVLAVLGWPTPARIAVLLAVIAPVALALGMPFPLGLKRAAEAGGGLLPWAWGLNGAFSVVATPLASLIAVQSGLARVLLGAALVYGIACIAYPSARRRIAWQQIPAPSHDPG